MTFLPIVGRELRVAARRRLTYWQRSLSGLMAITIGVLAYLDDYKSNPLVFAQEVFWMVAVIAILYCVFSGVAFAADSLSEEKREGTLGLLFLTDLKGYDVVLGKLAATSTNGFCAVLALLPILAVPLLLGGVSVGTFWRVVLVLLLTALFSLAISMFASAISRSRGKARVGACGWLLFFVAVLPCAAGLILAYAPSHRSAVADHLMLPCPFYALVKADDPMYRSGLRYYWRSVGVIHGLTWLFFWLAALVAPRTWQDRPAEGRGQRWREAWRNLVYGDERRRRAFRTCLLGVNPVFWLAARTRTGPVLVWAAIGVAGALWAWGWADNGSEWLNEGVFFPMAIVLNSILKLWVGSEAGRRFAEDRHSGALELVVSTPLSVKEILRGQWLALRRQFLGPLLTVIGVELIFLAASLQRESLSAQPLNPALWVVGLVMLVADLWALGWAGMWEAMTAKKPNYVTGKTVARILVAPWVAYVAILIVGAYLTRDLPPPQPPLPVWPFYVGLWVVVGLLTDIGFGVGAAWHLRRSFRTLALQRFAPAPSAFRRLLRWVTGPSRLTTPGLRPRPGPQPERP
jgi:ABC-type transport system involved in multi-copper enzyme maturation permease subunit